MDEWGQEALLIVKENLTQAQDARGILNLKGLKMITTVVSGMIIGAGFGYYGARNNCWLVSTLISCLICFVIGAVTRYFDMP